MNLKAIESFHRLKQKAYDWDFLIPLEVYFVTTRYIAHNIVARSSQQRFQPAQHATVAQQLLALLRVAQQLRNSYVRYTQLGNSCHPHGVGTQLLC